VKTSWILFVGLSIFYAILTVVYWQLGGEAVGITAIALSAGLALIVGFYLWFTDRRLGNLLPEDNQQGEIADSAGEIGFFSPHSWWPLPVALSASALALGLIIGWWLVLLALGALIVSIMGMVLEYERPTTSAH
jgi:Cytochrome c oxidase subunit IV